MSCGSAVDEERQAGAFVIAGAGLVPQNGEEMTVVGQAVDGVEAPLIFRYERMEDDAVIRTWTQADEAGDEWVGEAGVVVVVAATDLLVLLNEHAFGDPLIGVGVEVFVDPVDGMAAGESLVLGQ